jgi:hypothetical protein
VRGKGRARHPPLCGARARERSGRQLAVEQRRVDGPVAGPEEGEKVMFKRLACGLVLLGGAVMFTHEGATLAADHLDGPRAKGDPAADITDVYAFMSPTNAGHLALVLNVAPLAPATAAFSDAVTYTFEIKPVVTTQPLVFGQSMDITCRLAGGAMTCESVEGLTRTVATEKSGSCGQGDAMCVFAGRRADPFFIDFKALSATINTHHLSFSAPGHAVNFTDGLNVLSLVVEVDVDAIFPHRGLFAVSGKTERTDARGTGVIDRSGRPQVNFFFNFKDDVLQDAFNQETPFQDWTANHTFEASFQKNLGNFDMFDGVNDWGTGTHPLRDLFEQDLLLVDTGTECTEAAGNDRCKSSYFEIERELFLGGPAHTTCGGRMLGDDVVDKLLTLLVTKDRAKIGDNVDAATKQPTLVFPYGAEPN